MAFVIAGQVGGSQALFSHVRSCCLVGGQVLISTHAACPFGAVASVHAWERIGNAIAHLARRFLKLALFIYVDDMFAPERRAPVVVLW